MVGSEHDAAAYRPFHAVHPLEHVLGIVDHVVVARDRIHVGIGLEKAQQDVQVVVGHIVVGIHAHDVLAARGADGAIEAARQSALGLVA